MTKVVFDGAKLSKPGAGGGRMKFNFQVGDYVKHRHYGTIHKVVAVKSAKVMWDPSEPIWDTDENGKEFMWYKGDIRTMRLGGVRKMFHDSSEFDEYTPNGIDRAIARMK